MALILSEFPVLLLPMLNVIVSKYNVTPEHSIVLYGGEIWLIYQCPTFFSTPSLYCGVPNLRFSGTFKDKQLRGWVLWWVARGNGEGSDIDLRALIRRLNTS